MRAIGHREWLAGEVVLPEPPVAVEPRDGEPLQSPRRSTEPKQESPAPQSEALLQRIRPPFPPDLIVYYLCGRFPLLQRPNSSS